ncbi:unnamed protein product [Hermetia illucens]|uniref:Uncharacterized protein n=1 Tax=Hermetia illucens TaxID=343691 RepID=A0A7R8UX47_HERIL|nr:protein Cep89 homolog [Hermetia illucens]CAD7088732.1 unnamed protein product [Hermetia illucens]
MTSSIPVRKTTETVRKIVTDLDQPDEPTVGAEVQKVRKPHRHVHRERTKEAKKVSRSFPAERSRSFERDSKHSTGYLQVLVQTKDEQIEKLLQKVTGLHNYNDQFSVENETLRSEIHTLSGKLQEMAKQLTEYEDRECSKCLQYARLHDELSNEHQSLLKTNKTLTDDVSMMKTLVYRLNVQLERYQEILRKCNENDEDLTEPGTRTLSEDNETTVRKWGSVKTHTLAPLLNAYEEMLKEKADLILQHDREINRFTGHLKVIIAENEKLHAEMDELRKGKDGWLEDKTRLQAQVEICRGKAEVQTRRADIAKEKLVEVLRCYEQKVQGQSLDIERLQEAYSRAKGEIISLRNAHAHPDTIVESLKECQRLFEELKAQHDNEKTRISNDLAECRKLHSDMEATVSKLREENATLRASADQYRQSADSLRKKYTSLRYKVRTVIDSRENLKSKLRTALEWAQKLDESRQKMKTSWDDVKGLETVIRHKEAQIRGLHARHAEEIGRLERKLQQREETIKCILQEKAKVNISRKME